jgi:GntR family transcriptional repressor for pyruvate dehydrogenase complex
MSKLRAVERVTLSEQVAVQLAAMIDEGRWKPGVKLPAELELCTALSVGRSTLREALKSLAFIGLVRMRAGDGTYVAEPSRGLLDRILAKGLLKTEKDLADVCETRMILEIESAGLAAERATSKDISMLSELIGRSEERLRGNRREYSEMDLQFHLSVANCSQNKLLPRLLIDIRGLLVEWIAKSQELPGLVENAHQQHNRIFESIAGHDAAAARREMRTHLETFQRAYTLLGRISHAGTIAVDGSDQASSAPQPESSSAF